MVTVPTSLVIAGFNLGALAHQLGNLFPAKWVPDSLLKPILGFLLRSSELTSSIYLLYTALIKSLAVILTTAIVSLTIYHLVCLFMYTKASVTSNSSAPQQVQNQTVVLNQISAVSPNNNKGNKILMLLAFSQSLFETSPAQFQTDTQKVHHVAKKLTSKACIWYAKVTLQGEKLLNNCPAFCNSLLSTVVIAQTTEELRDHIMTLYQGRMATKDYVKEFSCLKEAIGMTDAKTCYLFQKKLSPELKNFLAHHVLPDKFLELTKEVLKWSSKVKQLPSWNNSKTPPAQNSPSPAKVSKGLVPKPGGGYQLAPKEKQC
ncbi:hypothetical protein DSO57_1039611 [Entomophthora muscae]|nr:hypothetical protein DSO57_1039611 [Entomophthora muscae]